MRFGISTFSFRKLLRSAQSDRRKNAFFVVRRWISLEPRNCELTCAFVVAPALFSRQPPDALKLLDQLAC